MRTLSELTKNQLAKAHDTAGKRTSETFRNYLPSRMLPLLLACHKDDLAEALGMALPLLPQRSGSARVVKLDDLTTGELNKVSEAALILVTRYADTRDDPLLPKPPRDFWEALAIEKADRARIADELRDKAKGIVSVAVTDERRASRRVAGCRSSRAPVPCPITGRLSPSWPIDCLMTVLSLMSFHPLAHAYEAPFESPRTVGDVVALCAGGQLRKIRGLGRRRVSESKPPSSWPALTSPRAAPRHGQGIRTCGRGKKGE